METWRNELYHHGILGQKWGVRRYQNKDGSLTARGIKRYYSKNGRMHNSRTGEDEVFGQQYLNSAGKRLRDKQIKENDLRGKHGVTYEKVKGQFSKQKLLKFGKQQHDEFQEEEELMEGRKASEAKYNKLSAKTEKTRQEIRSNIEKAVKELYGDEVFKKPIIDFNNAKATTVGKHVVDSVLREIENDASIEYDDHLWEQWGGYIKYK